MQTTLTASLPVCPGTPLSLTWQSPGPRVRYSSPISLNPASMAAFLSSLTGRTGSLG